MKKKITRAYKEANAKLLVDRFFEVCRKNLKIFAFQDKSEIEIDCLKEHNVCFLITREPKRKFFIDANILIDEGFIIEYNNFNQELLSKVKYEAIKHFGNKFFIKFLKDDNRDSPNKEFFSGKIRCQNLKKKEETVWLKFMMEIK